MRPTPPPSLTPPLPPLPPAKLISTSDQMVPLGNHQPLAAVSAATVAAASVAATATAASALLQLATPPGAVDRHLPVAKLKHAEPPPVPRPSPALLPTAPVVLPNASSTAQAATVPVLALADVAASPAPAPTEPTAASKLAPARPAGRRLFARFSAAVNLGVAEAEADLAAATGAGHTSPGASARCRQAPRHIRFVQHGDALTAVLMPTPEIDSATAGASTDAATFPHTPPPPPLSAHATAAAAVKAFSPAFGSRRIAWADGSRDDDTFGFACFTRELGALLRGIVPGPCMPLPRTATPKRSALRGSRRRVAVGAAGGTGAGAGTQKKEAMPASAAGMRAGGRAHEDEEDDDTLAECAVQPPTPMRRAPAKSFLGDMAQQRFGLRDVGWNRRKEGPARGGVWGWEGSTSVREGRVEKLLLPSGPAG